MGAGATCGLERSLRPPLPREQHVGGRSQLLSPLAKKHPPNQAASPPALPRVFRVQPRLGEAGDRPEPATPGCLLSAAPSCPLRPHRPGTTCPEAVTTCAPSVAGWGRERTKPGLASRSLSSL